MELNYLEIIENLTEEERLEKQQQIVRIEVKDEADAAIKAKTYEPAFKGKGLNYEKRMLTQNHYADADKNQPCKIKKI